MVTLSSFSSFGGILLDNEILKNVKRWTVTVVRLRLKIVECPDEYICIHSLIELQLQLSLQHSLGNSLQAFCQSVKFITLTKEDN